MRRALLGASALLIQAHLLLVASGCVTRAYNHSIVLKGSESTDEKVAHATAIATPARLARLKEELKAQLPGLTDDQLAGLRLTWRKTVFQSLTGEGRTTTVAVLVTLRYDSTFDPKPVVGAAVSILERELNPIGVPQEESQD